MEPRRTTTWRQRARWLYQATMAGLALAVVWLVASPEEPWTRGANLAVWAVFLTDYLVRFTLAKDRRRFVRENIPDLLAVIPFDFISGDDALGLARLMRLARFIALIRLLRAGVVLWRVSRNLRGILETNGFGYVLLVTTTLILLGGVGIWIVEPEIGSVGDGLWWGLVTTTTIGYGDIAPKTAIGRIIAAVLMIVGIGTIGLMTGTIATYFLGQRRKANPNVEHIVEQLERWDELSLKERRQLAAIVAALAEVRDDSTADGGR